MYGPNDRLSYWLVESHHQDLIRESARERMIREALRDRPKPVPFYARMLRWVEQRLQDRRSSPQREKVMPARVSPCPSPCPE